MKIMTRQWLVAASLLFVLVNCSPDDNTGSALLGVSTQALSASDVTKVTITISGPNISPNIVQDLVKTGSQWKGIIGKIPVGTNRTFTAEAFDSGNNKIYSGSAIHTISKGAPAIVNILLQQVTPPNPFQNTVPDITALTASAAQVGNDETINFTVTANDVDGDALTYNWTASTGAFTAGANSTNATWQAPSASFTGNVTISVEVTDGAKGGKTGTSVVIEVQPHFSTGKAKVSVEFNTWPDVNQVTSTKGRVNVGESTNLAAVAVDNDGDTLSYAWSDGPGSDCQAGMFSNDAAAIPTATWTAPAVAPASGECTLTVTVTDGRGGTNTGSVTIKIAAPQAANVAPKLTTTFQSTDTIDPGQTVTFRVVATDPENTAVALTWTASNGSLGAANNTGSGPYQSEVLWTAPSSGCSSTITLTATDADGQVTTHDFAVTINCTPPARQVAASYQHGCALQTNGTVKCSGANTVGELGNGTNISSLTPVTVSGITNAVEVVSGAGYACARLNDGTVKCWGRNQYGQLGNGTTTNSNVPVVVSGLSGVVGLSAKWFHVCALLNNGTAKCWGYNFSGQVGNGNTTNQSTPQTVAGLSNITQIATGYYHTCALLTDTTVRCWGSGAYYQLGNGITADQTSPQVATGVTGVSKLVAGGGHTCALFAGGTVKCWGINNYGQIGIGNTINQSSPQTVPGVTTATDLDAGNEHTCVVLANGDGRCWGANVGFGGGRLGIGNHSAQSTSPAVVVLPSSPKLKTISTGYVHTCAVMTDDSVYCWGGGTDGRLGIGNSGALVSPGLTSY